jgi:hypothetical protein
MLRLRKCIGCPSKGERSNPTIGGTTWLLLGIPSGSAKSDTRSSRLFSPSGDRILLSTLSMDNLSSQSCPGKHVPSAIQEEFQHEEAGRTTEGHGARVRSASREAQSAFYSVVLRRPPCFLRVEILADAPRPRSPRRKTRGELVRSHIDAIQAIVLGLFNRVGEFAATEAIPFIALLAAPHRCSSGNPSARWSHASRLCCCWGFILAMQHLPTLHRSA